MLYREAAMEFKSALRRWYDKKSGRTYEYLKSLCHKKGYKVAASTLQRNKETDNLVRPETWDAVYNTLPAHFPPPPWMINISNCDVDIDHICIVRQFKDKKTAEEINKNLLDIERASNTHFKECSDFVKFKKSQLAEPRSPKTNAGDKPATKKA